MIKTLRFLLLTGIATILCVSCTKEEPPTKPINVTTNPKHACTNPTLVRVVKDNDNVFRHDTIDMGDAQVTFAVDDSLILTTAPKNGYTFINWTRDGKEISIDSIYSFKLEEDDVDADKHYIKHHYEARFGIDYALQVIPDIHKVIPSDLVYYMDSIYYMDHNGDDSIVSALHFGDNPPVFDTLGFAQTAGSMILKKHFIPSDPNKVYSVMANSNSFLARDWFRFYDQHRGVAKFNFKHVNQDDYSTSGMYYIEYANTDTVFIMGQDTCFTAYFTIKRQLETSYSVIQERGSNEYYVISGIITQEGIKDLYYGIKIKSYDNPTDPGNDSMNYDDIAVFKIENLPYTYWDPSQHYSN